MCVLRSFGCVLVGVDMCLFVLCWFCCSGAFLLVSLLFVTCLFLYCVGLLICLRVCVCVCVCVFWYLSFGCLRGFLLFCVFVCSNICLYVRVFDRLFGRLYVLVDVSLYTFVLLYTCLLESWIGGLGCLLVFMVAWALGSLFVSDF